MKKEIRALLPHRKTRLVPLILAGLAALIVCGGLLSLAMFFVRGPGRAIFYTATPTPTLTPTPLPATPTSPFTETPAASPLPTNTSGPSPTPTPQVYVVQEGDSISSIAAKFSTEFGVIITPEDIMLANQLTNTIINPGLQLIIPMPGAVTSPTPSPLPTGLGRGSKIASKFNSTVDAIVKANKNAKLTNASLQAGMVILVPINLVTPTPTYTISLTPAATLTPTPTQP
jgi:LysM repeat protein